MNNKRIKLSRWAKMNGYSYHGAFRLFKRGLLKNAVQIETGSIFVEISNENESITDYTIIYSRVSSSENRHNLKSQSKRLHDFCVSNGWRIDEIVEECASGLNDSRPKLQKILQEKKATRLVVEHKDRLTRFGFAYIETLFPGKIIVVNNCEEIEQDIMQDFISIITSFCARIYGNRRSKRKSARIIQELSNDDN
jgi:putative resolvase